MPVSAFGREHRFEIVPKILPRAFKAVTKTVFFLEWSTQQEVAQAQGHRSDGDECDRVAKERGHDRGRDIGAHHFGDDRCDNEVQAKERRKTDEDACENTARNFGRTIG